MATLDTHRSEFRDPNELALLFAILTHDFRRHAFNYSYWSVGVNPIRGLFLDCRKSLWSLDLWRRGGPIRSDRTISRDSDGTMRRLRPMHKVS